MTVDYLCILCVLSPQQDFDQNKLEEEMRKRKERVEKWREDQRKKALGNIEEIKREIEEMKQGKKWSLEDDDGEEQAQASTFHGCVVGVHVYLNALVSTFKD